MNFALQYKQNNQFRKLQMHDNHGRHGHDARHGFQNVKTNLHKLQVHDDHGRHGHDARHGPSKRQDMFSAMEINANSHSFTLS